ncbi:unnamed protein product [Paramecium octaurelia]|uniref:Uncharacterized protein n=1 Tax=Paramecium octaurelia TaxID=43137 RepID=A0A8S1V1D0_PAROT|nr:unnamed protein product [Paramecium octaurelia]
MIKILTNYNNFSEYKIKYQIDIHPLQGKKSLPEYVGKIFEEAKQNNNC